MVLSYPLEVNLVFKSRGNLARLIKKFVKTVAGAIFICCHKFLVKVSREDEAQVFQMAGINFAFGPGGGRNAKQNYGGS